MTSSSITPHSRELQRLLQAATAESSSSSSSSTLLPALHSALLHATTHVPGVLDALEQEVAFLSSNHAKQKAAANTTARFGRDIIDDDFLDAEIERRKRRLRELREARSARHVIVGATVQSHVVQRALASQDRSALSTAPAPSRATVLASIASAKGVPLTDDETGPSIGRRKRPAAPLGQRDENAADRGIARQIIEGDLTGEVHQAVPLTKIPISSLLETRDELALELLKLRAQLEKQSKRRDLVRLGDADKGFEGLEALRRSVADLLKEAREARPPPLPSGSGLPSTLTSSLGSSGQAVVDADTSRDAADEDDERIKLARRVDKARRMLREMRAKREMVKGVLRGIILESTLDWASDDKLAKLMLEELRDLSEAESESDEERRERDDDEEADDEDVQLATRRARGGRE